MHALLTLCILALSLHSVVMDDYNCVRIANVGASSAEINLWTAEGASAGKATLAAGEYKGFSDLTAFKAPFDMITDGAPDTSIHIGYIFNETSEGCASRQAPVKPVTGACHKPPCCKTTVDVAYAEGKWTVSGKIAVTSANPHIIWTCSHVVEAGTTSDEFLFTTIAAGIGAVAGGLSIADTFRSWFG